MKKLFLILLVLLLFGCTETIYETITGNLIPIIEINPRIETVIKDTEVTFTADIIDDDTEHTLTWLLDGVEIFEGEEYIYTASLEIQPNHSIGLLVSDGEITAIDFIDFTVQEPPWSPEPMIIYIFEVGTEANEVNIVKTYVAVDEADYIRLVSAVRTTIEIHNMTEDPDWYSVAGGL